MNRWHGAGYMTKAADIRFTKSGRKVANFFIACRKRPSKERTDQQQDADFIQCTAWGKTADVLEQYGGRGTYLVVTGRAAVRTYEDSNGTKHWVTEMMIDELDLGPKRESKTSPADSSWEHPRSFGQATAASADDIPF